VDGDLRSFRANSVIAGGSQRFACLWNDL